MAEHWRLKPEVSWVRLPATSLFTFLYVYLITSSIIHRVQVIVGDGAKIWIYDPDLAQVTVREVDAALGSTPAVLLTTDRPVEEQFRVEALDAGAGFEAFALEPRAEDASFTSIRLAFAGGELRRMELVDQFGQTSVIRFTDVRRQPAVPPGAFTFTPPAGVDVIDAGR